MARNRAARLPRHWCALCLCVMTILVQCHLPSANDARPPLGRVKRNSVLHPVQDFLKAVKTRPVDLIILMERSWHVGRHRFYLRARKLVSYVMRYYVKMGPFDVRLVLATFATDFTVHIHGMRDNILKCQIWDQYWNDVVLVDTPDSVWNMAHVKRAYEKAEDIFIKYGSVDREKYIWLLTSGNYRMEGIYNPLPIADVLRKMGVQMVATKVGGVEGHNENIRQVVSSSHHHGGEVQDWITTLQKVAEITDDPDLIRSSTSTLCYCEQLFGFTICGGCLAEPCAFGTTCTRDCICTGFNPHLLCPKLNTRKVCDIYSGQTGRYCQLEVIECVPGTCANNGICHEGQRSSYSCTCPGLFLPQYLCEHEGVFNKSNKTDDDRNTSVVGSGTSSVGPAVGGALGALTLVIILVAGVCIWRRKNRRPETRDAETYTNQNQLNTSSTISSLNVFDLFRRKRGMQARSDGYTGTYLEVEPPTLPNGLPPPTVHYLSPRAKARMSLSRLLQYIPKHLHPSTHQVEVERPVSVINMDHQGAAGGADGEEHGDYENVGSKNMPGWDQYATKLATEGGLRNFAIVKYDREAYVTTCEIWLLPSKDELTHIYNVMLSRHTGDFVTIKSARYKVTKNNGKMLESWLEGRTPDVLCIGRSKQYLTLGVETDRAKTGNCYQEVRWVRDNLSEQGK